MRLGTAAVLCAMTASAARARPPRYEVIPIPVYDQPDTDTWYVGLDGRGRVAANILDLTGGYPYVERRAAIWEDGEWTLLPLLGTATRSEVFDISNAGMVGRVGAESDEYLAATVWHDGGIKVVPNPKPWLWFDVHAASGISANGRVAGMYRTSSSTHARLFTMNGLDVEVIDSDLTAPPPGFGWFYYGTSPRINSAGSMLFDAQIDGHDRNAVYEDGSAYELPIPEWAVTSYAQSINDAGIVAGYVSKSDYSYRGLPMRWVHGDPEPLSMAGGEAGAWVGAINNSGAVVGTVDAADGFSFGALWESDRRYTLSDYVDLPDGFGVFFAWDIADDGSILASIARQDMPGSPSESYRAILRPVPAPAGCSLVAAGLFAVRRRRTRHA